MFDVSWTDPARETIGERRTRKEQNGGSIRKQTAMSRRSSSIRSSRSSESAKPSLLSIFSSSKKPTADWTRSLKKIEVEPETDQRCSIYTTESGSSIHELPESTALSCPSLNILFEERRLSDTERSNPSDPSESVFSAWSGFRSNSSWSSVIDTSTLCAGSSTEVVQPLSPTSFVTQSTEITVSPRDGIRADEQTATIVHISAASIPVQIQDIPDSPSLSASPPSTFVFPLPLPNPHAFSPPTSFDISPHPSIPHTSTEAKSRVGLKKELYMSHISSSSSFGSQGSTTPRQWPHSSLHDRLSESPAPIAIAESWKPPETWDCPASSPGSSNCSLSPTTTTHPRPRIHRSPQSPPPALVALPLIPRRASKRDALKHRHKSPSASAEILHLQRTMRMMQSASKKIMLERLREHWTGVADASVYRELELQKQMWMLMALRSFDGRRSMDSGRDVDSERHHPSVSEEPRQRRGTFGPDASQDSKKILSLFENHASASSLAAMAAQGAELHHLATNPISTEQYPNTLPLTVPSVTTNLPYPSATFSSIHAFSLPALLPSSSIPTILRECHRTLSSPVSSLSAPTKGSLAPNIPEAMGASSISPHTDLTDIVTYSSGGTLHLTLIDPSPLPGTLGPRLRNWLDNHLVLNLEKQFRCINPSRLFPDWLADAGLRAPGSTVMYVQFFASVPSASWSGCHSPAASRAGDEDSDGDGNERLRKEEYVEDGRVKQELKSVVGRMLWKEIWGSHVLGQNWWWEDESIVDECERMGTIWEYCVIEAVKGE